MTFALAAIPAAAATVFEQLYPARDGGLSLPYPFSALVADLEARTGAELQVGFIPLGRSLQRFGADPDYFTSPRIILSVTANGKGGMKLRDRLFIGYQPAVAALEVIAFDEAANQFRFLQVEDYREPDGQSFTAIDEKNCLACHQSRGPIFSAPPWDESNANPGVAVKLPATVAGLAVRQDFDGIDQFARSVQRANRLAAAALLQQVLARKQASQSVAAALADAFPQGLSVIDPKIPNRDPAALVASGMPPMEALETQGAFDPETPRQPLLLWKPGPAGEADALRLMGEVAIP
ncbi:MAG: hypothetical protein AB7F74_21880 [Parvibaculaceae bacterium]